MKKGGCYGERHIGAPKSVAGFREVPIDADLAEVLRAYWNALPKRQKGEGWLFPFRDGTALDGTNLRIRVLYRACKAAGLPRAEWPTWHDLRHAFATGYLNKRGNDFKRVMDLMGHADMRTTLIYSHVTEDNVRDEVDREAIPEAMPFDLTSDRDAPAQNVVPFTKAS